MNKITTKLFAILLIFCLFGNLATAATDSPLSPDARQAIEQGNSAAKSKNWQQAIDNFQKARELAPFSPVVLYNLAQAYHAAGGRELLAITYYRCYLAAVQYDDNNNADKVRSRIKQLEEQIKVHAGKLVDDAQQIVPAVKERGYKASADSSIAQAEARLGDIRKAKNIADQIEVAYFKCQAYIEIAKEFSRKDNFSEAYKSLSTAKILAQSDTKDSYALADVTRAYNELADKQFNLSKDQADAGNIEQAKKIAAGIEDNYLKGNAYCYIAEAQAKAGDITGAMHTAANNKITYVELNWQTFTYYKLALLLIEAGKISQAKDMENKIDVDLVPILYCEIADAYTKNNDLDLANNLLNKALRLAEKDKDAFIYRSIAEQYIKTGNNDLAQTLLKTAKEIASGINDNDKKANNYKLIAGLQAKAGNVAAAKKTAEIIEQKPKKTQAFVDIASAQAESADFAGAKQTADSIENKAAGTWTYNFIAQQQFKAKDISSAQTTMVKVLDMAKAIPKDDEFRDFTYQAIAEVKTEIGNITEAKNVAKDIINLHRKYLAYNYIAEMQLKSDDITGAKETNLAKAEALAHEEIEFWQKLAKNQLYNKSLTDLKELAKKVKPEKYYDAVYELCNTAKKLLDILELFHDKEIEWQKHRINDIDFKSNKV